MGDRPAATLHRGRRSLAAILLVAAASAAAAQPPASPHVATAVRISEKPTIDGILDEAFWRDIGPITEFKQREPREGAGPSERTEVRIAYDEDALYFGLTLFDREPEKIRRSILQREGRIDQDDRIIIGLDTYFDRRNAYVFEINAFGAQGDAIVTDEGQPNWNWEGVYSSEGRITESGWTLEVEIPFSTIRYDQVAQPTMGVAFYRSIRRKNEEVFWPLIGVNYRAHIFQVSQYARLEGLQGLRRHRNLQVKPYLLLGGQRPGSQGLATEVTRNLGADARYAVTSDATLDFTYNTDFAQVEADNAQVNLTRFSLFYPEKREFFLERNGLFSFGAPNVNMQGSGTSQPLEAATYFSRRIGLAQPIAGSGRYSGKTGIFSIGLMDIQTKREGELAPANYGVARVRADLRPGTTVGTIFTNVSTAGTFNRVAGIDLAHRFWRSSSLNMWTSHVWGTNHPPSSAAANVNLLLRNDRYSYELDYLNVGRNFDPAVGFVRRLDMIRYRNEIGYSPRIGSGDQPIRQLRFIARAFYLEGQDHQKQSTEQYGRASALFEGGEEIGVDHTRAFDRVATPFHISGREVAAGDYVFSSTKFYVNSNSSRRFYGQVNGGTGTFYGGDRTFFGGNLQYKFSPKLAVGTTLDRNNFSLPGAGDFSTTVVAFDVFAAQGRKFYNQSLIQYDSVSRDWTANIRFRWLHRPGSDFFVVFNTMHHRRDPLDPHDVAVGRRTGVAKLTYLVAF